MTRQITEKCGCSCRPFHALAPAVARPQREHTFRIKRVTKLGISSDAQAGRRDWVLCGRREKNCGGLGRAARALAAGVVDAEDSAAVLLRLIKKTSSDFVFAGAREKEKEKTYVWRGDEGLTRLRSNDFGLDRAAVHTERKNMSKSAALKGLKRRGKQNGRAVNAEAVQDLANGLGGRDKVLAVRHDVDGANSLGLRERPDVKL